MKQKRPKTRRRKRHEPARGAAITMYGSTRVARRRLDSGNLTFDFFGRPAGLVGQVLNLGSDDRETLAGLAGAGRLDGGVEGQQVGLLGNGLDDLDHGADGC